MSTLGCAALLLAVDAGADVTATTRSTEHFDTLKRSGAASVKFERIYLVNEFEQPIKFDKVLNLIGNNVLLESTHLTRVGGRVLSAGCSDDKEPQAALNPMQIEPGVHISLFSRDLLGSPEMPFSAIPLQDAVQNIESGRWEVEPALVFEYNNVVDAHAILESMMDTTGGKVVVKY